MWPRCGMALFAALACLMPGCGTFINLTLPPSEEHFNSWGLPGDCQPFGGTRVSLGGCYLLLQSPYTVPLSLLCLADVPLSATGDLLTLPIVYARHNGEPWATWWGGDRMHGPPWVIPKESNSDENNVTKSPQSGAATESSPSSAPAASAGDH
jgi:hypothetical protein